MEISKVYISKNGYKHHAEIKIHANGFGSFEYWVEDHDEETYVEGSLSVEGKEVIDFDGCFDLPKAVKKALNDNGYATDW